MLSMFIPSSRDWSSRSVSTSVSHVVYPQVKTGLESVVPNWAFANQYELTPPVNLFLIAARRYIDCYTFAVNRDLPVWEKPDVLLHCRYVGTFAAARRLIEQTSCGGEAIRQEPCGVKQPDAS